MSQLQFEDIFSHVRSFKSPFICRSTTVQMLLGRLERPKQCFLLFLVTISLCAAYICEASDMTISKHSPTMSHLGSVCCRKATQQLEAQFEVSVLLCVCECVCNRMLAVSVLVVAVCQNRLALYGMFGL